MSSTPSGVEAVAVSKAASGRADRTVEHRRGGGGGGRRRGPARSPVAARRARRAATSGPRDPYRSRVVAGTVGQPPRAAISR